MDLDAIPPAPRSPSPLAMQIVTGGGPGAKVLRIIGLAFDAVGLLVFVILKLSGIPFPFFLLPLLFVVIGSCLYAGGAVTASTRNHVFRNGTATTGKVTFSGPDYRTRINGQSPFRLQYQFTTDQGTFTGSISSLNMTVLQGLPQNGQVPVLYDPGNPRKNTLYVE